MKNSGIPAILIWVLYGLTAGCFLFLTAMTICSDNGHGAEMGLIVGAVILAVLGGASLGLSRIDWPFQWGRGTSKKMFVLVMESMTVVILLVLMVAVRVLAFGRTNIWKIVDDPTYALAQIDASIETGGNALVIAHGGRELYVRLLRSCMFFLGNKPQAVVVVQLVLLVLAALGLYFGIRKSAGAFTAVVVLAALGFSPYMMRETCKPSALLLILLIYGMAAGTIAGLPEQMEGKRLWAILHFIWTGLLIGICCFLDMAGIALLILLTGTICFGSENSNEKENENDGESEKGVFGGQLMAFLVCVLAAAGGYFLCHVIRGSGGMGLNASLNAQLELYLPQRFILPMGVVSPGTQVWDMMVVAIWMSVGIFSFWVSHRIRIKGIWLFTAAFLFLMQCLQMGDLNAFNTYGLLYLIGVVMGAASVQDLFMPQRAVEREGVDEMQETYTENGENQEPVGMEAAQNPASVADAGAAGGQEKLEKVDLDSEAVAVTKVQYIENPLPLPKKKEHKAMDYDYEVSEYDDFDIP